MRRLPLQIGLVVAIAACRLQALPSVRDGDLVFQTSRSAQSAAIQQATHSVESHIGMVEYRAGKPYVLEAISTVRYTPLAEWLARGAGGHYVIKRLRDADRVLTFDGEAKLRSRAERLLGRPYDLTFEWSDDRVYCSELVWKAYHDALAVDLGALTTLRTFDLSAPAVQAKMRERYGDRVPLDEPVISPAAMFSSPLLITVAEQ